MTDNHKLSDLSITFFGAGSMAEAIVRGLVEAKLTEPSRITVVNRQNAERLRELSKAYGVIPAIEDNQKLDALRRADVILLGMKPKDAANAIRSLQPLLRPEQLIVSVIAGLSIATIHQLLDHPQPVVRAMPNTSSTIGLGATGVSFSETVTEAQRAISLAIFNAVGMSVVVDESLIDAVNGVSGSGPAYIYFMMEAMIDAGVQLGLSREDATALTAQTVRGAGEMVKLTGEDPSELRRKVTSPNGTTFAALEVLRQFDFQEGTSKAVVRCAERAREMGEAIRAEAAAPQQRQ
jgi:pyrroline-5-carboxylate reductase